MWKRLRKMDIDFIVKMFYSVVLIIAFVITIMICVNSPVQRHFKNMGKNDVWFGDEWYYTGTSQTITTRAKRYLQVQIEEGGVSISKTLDFTPSPEEYLCFRARALDTTVYVNDTLWYQHSYQQKYRSHGKRMYMLHQVQTKGFEKGDVITLVLENMADEGSATIQFLAVGDRYALIRYIMEKSYRSLGVYGDWTSYFVKSDCKPFCNIGRQNARCPFLGMAYLFFGTFCHISCDGLWVYGNLY